MRVRDVHPTGAAPELEDLAGGFGEGRHAAARALLRERVIAGMDRAPVGKGRLAGHRQGHERVSAKPELAPLAVDAEPLDPLLRAGARHPQDQAVAVPIVAGRRDLVHERRREHVVAPMIVCIHRPSLRLSPHQNRTLPDSIGQYNTVPESVSGANYLFIGGKAGGSA